MVIAFVWEAEEEMHHRSSGFFSQIDNKLIATNRVQVIKVATFVPKPTGVQPIDFLYMHIHITIALLSSLRSRVHPNNMSV